jgi:hypothetical protein
MDSVPKRPRGRPKGSGKDDAAALNRVADMLVSNPDMKPTRAMKQCIKEIGETELRRLQDKWKRHGADLRLAAEQRAQRRHEARRAVAGGGLGLTGQRLHDALNPPWMRQLREMQERMEALQGGPLMKHFREMQERMEALQSSPIMRQLRELQERAHAMAESPLMKRVHDLQEQLGRSAAITEALGVRRYLGT